MNGSSDLTDKMPACFIDGITRHDLTVAEREEYIKAVLCLQSKPPKADQTKYPGVLSRYDDFVLTHETQAMHLHSTVSRTHLSTQYTDSQY
jgi:hypothetical protein